MKIPLFLTITRKTRKIQQTEQKAAANFIFREKNFRVFQV